MGELLLVRHGETAWSRTVWRDGVIARDGDVAIIGHGHLQRVLAARWLGLDPAAARMLSHPHTGTVSALAYEHELPVVSAWNVHP